MLETKNRIEVVGKVKNFKVDELKSGKKKASIGIKDELKNNYVNVTLFDRKNLTYGEKGNAKEFTLDGLKKVFLDTGDKPKDILVTAVGVTSEYTNPEGNTYTNNTVFGLYPCSDENKQKATFMLQGVVESISTLQDENENDYLKIKVGTINVMNMTDVTGVNYKTVVVRNEKLVEKLEDAAKGDLVELKGYIINILPERDEFGDLVGRGRQEYEVVKGRIVNDDLDEADAALYKRAKNLDRGQVFSADDHYEQYEDFED